jgi:hypothetical protein
MNAALALEPEAETAGCCWEYFRMVGTERQLSDALRRLQGRGWQVLSNPEAGPFDTWAVHVRRPGGCPHAG